MEQIMIMNIIISFEHPPFSVIMSTMMTMMITFVWASPFATHFH